MPQGAYKNGGVTRGTVLKGIKKMKRVPQGDQQKLKKGSEFWRTAAVFTAGRRRPCAALALTPRPLRAPQTTISSRGITGRLPRRTMSSSRCALSSNLVLRARPLTIQTPCPPQSITKAISRKIESTMASRGSSDGAGLTIVQVDEQQQSGALGKRGRGKTTDIKEKKKKLRH